MTISITIDKKGFSGVKVANITDYLKRMAEIVKVDIQEHLENSQAITGGSLAPLSPKTVARKSKPHKIKYPGEAAMSAGKGKYISKFPSRPLIDGGNLLRNQTIEKVSDTEYVIKVGPQRKTPAKYLNEERKFFGISDTATGKIRSTVLKNVVVK